MTAIDVIAEYLHRAVGWEKTNATQHASAIVDRLKVAGLTPVKCDHWGWRFEKDGRCCSRCGVVLVDFGD